MSKKKAFSGSTMTLKDFHGGSIPSDLPLPSAPGTIPRNFERTGLDKTNPSSWGSPINRSDHRRPGSAGTSRNFDEKTSFFLHPPRIGRNFDEDERKPFDSGSRRSSGDGDSFPHSRSDRISLDHPDPKPSETKASSRIQMTGNQAPNPYAFNAPGRTVPANGNPVGIPNAWARIDAISCGESSQTSVPRAPSVSAASKLACASAIEKVSSGIWQSKLVISSDQSHTSIYQRELQHKEPERESDNYLGNSTYTEINRLQSRSLEVESPPDVDMSQADGLCRYNESRRYAEGLVPSRTEEFGGNDKEKSRLVRTISAEGKLGAQQQDEALERPKLKLLPRTKPMERQNSYTDDYKEIPQQYNSGNVGKHEAIHLPASDFPLADENGKAADRPRLNLKPRSQPSEQPENIGEKERKNIFGGARPRELVLKERGIDDVTVTVADTVGPPSRGKPDLQRSDAKIDVAAQHFGHVERVETFTADQRAGYRVEHANWQSDGHHIERKDNRDAEKVDRSKRNNNWRDDKNVEKPQEPPKETERWRKSELVTSRDARALRYGRAASAVDIVQAFSGSVSGAGKPEVLPNTRSLPSRLKDSGAVPGRSSEPFSRLLESSELYAGSKERRINGY